LAKVITIYKSLQNERPVKQRKKPISRLPVELLKRTEKLAFYSSIFTCNHRNHWCLKFEDGMSNEGRFFFHPVFKRNNGIPYDSLLVDLFNGKRSKLHFPMTPTNDLRKLTLCFMTNDIALLIERTCFTVHGFHAKFFLSLLHLDWKNNSIRMIQTLTFEDQQNPFKFQKIIVDSTNPAHFILRQWRNGILSLKFGKVENDEIIFGKQVASNAYRVCHGFCSLVGDTLYSLNLLNSDTFETSQVYITTFSEHSHASRFVLPSLPEGYSVVAGRKCAVGCIAMERLFLATKFHKTGIFEIFWIDFKVRKWTSMNFCTINPIMDVNFTVDEGILLVQTMDGESDVTFDQHNVKKTFYRIPLKTPDKLANLAWFSVVRSKRLPDDEDPYKEANRYLPFNSEIRPYE